ncbi:RtcB family protein [Propionibacterium freudenreichii]|uniref:RtcB family protein n=1 Tax=Propionibacterium freudenreichii TaxID=1744 RepID=UPI000543406B|nr:RtcB family protein [Propionibacterium freudenreichii]CEH00760.1 Putative uncharacterized protein [Propionibacterium freudenreichii]
MTELPVPVPGTTSDTLMWADPTTVEPEALDQLRAISRLPWLAKLRVMPDVHLGKGATVGSVIAMRDAVSPAAVGVDIGCGMVAARTNLTVDDLPDSLHAIRSRLEELVPVGWKSHTGTAPVLSRDEQLKGRFTTLFDRFGQLRAPHIDDRETRALSQSGTLGGGNHFLELQADDTGTVWLMLHSGSRNIGKELADRHITEAKGARPQPRSPRPRPGRLPGRHPRNGRLPPRPLLGPGVCAPEPRHHDAHLQGRHHRILPARHL